MKCKKHPKYKAMRKPRTNCNECGEMWEESEHNKGPFVMREPPEEPIQKSHTLEEYLSAFDTLQEIVDWAGDKDFSQVYVYGDSCLHEPHITFDVVEDDESFARRMREYEEELKKYKDWLKRNKNRINQYNKKREQVEQYREKIKELEEELC